MQLQSTRRRGVVLSVLILIGAVVAGHPASSMAQEISPSEKLLFQTNHFANVPKPTKLNYTYRQELATPDTFTDEVSVDILKRNGDGTASVAAHFLSGPHEIPIPAIDNAQGNPAILGFLERDIAEMKRLTGGAVGYFRKRIRLALTSPTIPLKKIMVTYEGRQVPAQEIAIQPYVDDPLKDRFGKYVDKGYVFIISDAVPGSLYQVYTTVSTDKAARAVESAMTIAKGETAAMAKAGTVAQK